MTLMMEMLLVVYSGPATVLSISHSLFHLLSQVNIVIIPILEVKEMRWQSRRSGLLEVTQLGSGQGGTQT